MGFEEILYVIITLLILCNIFTVILLKKSSNAVNSVANKLKLIINKNNKIKSGYSRITTLDLTDILADKVNYFESETEMLNLKLTKSETVNQKLTSLNDFISGHVNTINKDLDKFISSLLEQDDDELNVKDLQTLARKFKAALSKANHLQEGLYVRTELLQGYMEKIKNNKVDKTKNLSTLIVKNGSIKNKLSSVDKILYKQNSELLDIVDVITEIYEKVQNQYENVFDEMSNKLKENLKKRTSAINNLSCDSKIRHSLKDLNFIKKEIELLTNNEAAADIIVSDIKEKILSIENQLNKSLTNDSEVFNELSKLDIENIDQISSLFESTNHRSTINKEIDPIDIKRIISKTISRNEYLLQQVGDLLREAENVSEQSNLEWERAKSETTIMIEMKKNISIMMLMLESIKVDENKDEDFDLDLSQFRISEDGEILI